MPTRYSLAVVTARLRPATHAALNDEVASAAALEFEQMLTRAAQTIAETLTAKHGVIFESEVTL